jgi:hypothetical protein
MLDDSEVVIQQENYLIVYVDLWHQFASLIR